MNYKLIKCYPGSPKLGTIVDNNSNLFNITIAVNSKYSIVNYPEFWELQIEKDYEILDKEYTPGYCYHGNKNPNQWKIKSIKRLSDNEIFTIGDKIKLVEGKDIIEINIININNNTINFNWYENRLDSFKKVKQPLFKTEDDIELYENNKYYIVAKSLNISVNDEGIITKLFKPSERYLYFSTKEKAEEYIINNKPCLSLNDIKSILNQKYNTKFTELVKSKINNK